MISSVDVSVEVLQECMIQEITLDGHEIYVQPLTLSESLTKLAHKIDFSNDAFEEKGKDISETEKMEEDGDTENKNSFKNISLQPSLWPWDSVRNKLNCALSELNILQDILSISRERHYMALEYIPRDVADGRSAFLLVARRRALAIGSSIVSIGYERMRKNLDIIVKNKQTDFHCELLRLRNKWRLKKVGGAIFGDFSYQSAGSQFWKSGTFEVTKMETSSVLSPPESYPDLLANASPVANAQPSNLLVTIPNELHGVAYIQVTISQQLGNNDQGICNLLSKRLPKPGPLDLHWSRKLEDAQNVIFCMEIFAQLARDTIQIRTNLPHSIIENAITFYLFSDVKLSIILCHNTEKSKSKEVDFNKGLSSLEHNAVLEHTLHQLLREQHQLNQMLSNPHPVTAPLALTHRQRLAGPLAHHRNAFTDPNVRTSMLDELLKQAKHIVIRQRLIDMLQELVVMLPEPQLNIHSSATGLPVQTTLKITISFSGFNLIKTSFFLIIQFNCIKAITKDGHNAELSFEIAEIKDFILRQISEHHIFCVQSLAKVFGWKVSNTSRRVGVGDVEEMSNSSAITIISPYHDCILSARCGPTTEPRVFVQQCPQPNSYDSTIIENSGMHPKWAQVSQPFQEIHLRYMTTGHNFAYKTEAIIAALMPDRTA